MSYEKTIANDHRIYQITLPSSPTKVIDLLSAQDLEEYNGIINSGLPYVAGKDSAIKTFKRIVVDGYIVKYDGSFFVRASSSGVEMPVVAGQEYLFPILMWLDKTWIRGNGTALIRIFFS